MVQLAGFVYDSAGVALSTGITVNIYARNTVTPVVVSPTVNASGYWQATGVAEGRYDVEIVNGTTTRRIKYDDELQVQRVETAVLQVRNPANTFIYDVVPGAITANRTLNLPVITGTDTVAVLSLAQTFSTGVKTFNSSILAIRNPADTFSYTVVASAISAARNLTIPLITADDTLAVLGLAQTFTATQTMTSPVIVTSLTTTSTTFALVNATATTVNFAGAATTMAIGASSIVITLGSNATINGGSAANDDLTLQGTSNATRTTSYVLLQPNGGRVGIGVSSPADILDVAGGVRVTGANSQVAIEDRSNSANAWILYTTSNIMRIYQGSDRLLFDTNGNVKLGGSADRAGTVGTNQFDIFDGTAPTSTLANGISLYSTSGELRVMDSAGNATLLSPHDSEGRWIYDSVSPITGKHLQVDMERMVKFLNEKFGQDWVKEFAA